MSVLSRTLGWIALGFELAQDMVVHRKTGPKTVCSCKKMNLRQRVAWLCLALYLASSLAIVYYLFDVADQFTLFSVEHSRLYHSSQATSSFSWRSFWEHLVADLPLPLILLFMFLLYTHGFATLFYLTLPQASSKVNKCLIPVLGWFYLFQRVRALCQREQSSEEELSGSHYVISIS